MRLSELRLPNQTEQELSWFFGDWQGDAGLKSSFGAIVNLSVLGVATGGATDPEGDMMRKLSKAKRAKNIKRRLERCPSWAVRTLKAFYGWAGAPLATRRELAELGRLVPLVWQTEGWKAYTSEKRENQIAPSKAGGSRCSRLALLMIDAREGKDGGALSKMVGEANGLLARASMAYRSANEPTP